jgi:hypothetical protein
MLERVQGFGGANSRKNSRMSWLTAGKYSNANFVELIAPGDLNY